MHLAQGFQGDAAGLTGAIPLSRDAAALNHSTGGSRAVACNAGCHGAAARSGR